jgi:hypothetical protein
LWKLGVYQLARAPFVQWIRVRVQEGDCQRLHAAFDEIARARDDSGFVKRELDYAVGPDALRRFEAQAPRHQRLRQLDEQIVELVLVLAPHLERVAKARGRDEPGGRALAFDQRVGEQRRRVHHARHVAVSEPLGLEQPLDAGDHAAVRSVGSRELLMAVRHRCALVVHDDVGEGAADVQT